MAGFCFAEDGKYRETLGSKLDHMEFVLETADDVSKLPTTTQGAEVGGEWIGPCAPGSIAIAPGAIYMLDPAGNWFEL